MPRRASSGAASRAAKPVYREPLNAEPGSDRRHVAAHQFVGGVSMGRQNQRLSVAGQPGEPRPRGIEPHGGSGGDD